jgi:hypothetical protein
MKSKYYVEFFIFSAYGIILLICSPLDVSFLNNNGKGFELLYYSISGNILARSPVYGLLGWIVTRLPFLDSSLLIIFLSIIPAIASSILVYLCVYSHTKDRICSIIGSLSLMAGSLYFMQAQEIGYYTLGGFFIILSYWLIINKKFIWANIILLLSLLTCHIFAAAVIGIFSIMFYDIRKFSYIIVIPAMLYIVLAVSLNLYYFTILNAFSYTSSTVYLFDRIYSFAPQFIFIFSVGAIGSIFLMVKNIRLFLILCSPIGFSLANVLFSTHQTYNMLMPLIPLFCVSCGVGARYIKYKYALIVACVVMIGINCSVFSLRFIDSSPTTARQLYNDILMLPNGSIIETPISHDDSEYMSEIKINDIVLNANFNLNKKIVGIGSTYFTDRFRVKLIDEKKYSFQIVDVHENSK